MWLKLSYALVQALLAFLVWRQGRQEREEGVNEQIVRELKAAQDAIERANAARNRARSGAVQPDDPYRRD